MIMLIHTQVISNKNMAFDVGTKYRAYVALKKNPKQTTVRLLESKLWHGEGGHGLSVKVS